MHEGGIITGPQRIAIPSSHSSSSQNLILVRSREWYDTCAKERKIIERAITTQHDEYMGECVFVRNRGYRMAMRIDNYLIKFNFISVIICAIERSTYTQPGVSHIAYSSHYLLCQAKWIVRRQRNARQRTIFVVFFIFSVSSVQHTYEMVLLVHLWTLNFMFTINEFTMNVGSQKTNEFYVHIKELEIGWAQFE